MGGRRRPQQSFLAGRIENMQLGARKKKYQKWQAMKKGTLGVSTSKGKKMNSKGKKDVAKRMQKKNHGRMAKK